MKHMILPLPLFRTLKKRIALIAQGKGLNGEKGCIAHERAKKAFREQFDSLFSKKPFDIQEKKFRMILSQKQQWRTVRDNFRTEIMLQELIAASVEHRLHKRPIQWLSGSRSSALPLIFQKRLFFEKPSLIPTGMLLERGIAPLCGELFVGILFDNGINHTHLSGTTLINFPLALRYAQTNAPFCIGEKKKKLFSLLSYCEKNSCIHLEATLLAIIVLQLLEMDGLSVPEKEEIKARLLTCKLKFPKPIDATLNALETVSPLPLSSIERSFIEDSFPLIFGSLADETFEENDLIHFSPIQLSEQKEKTLKGPRALGEKIQFLFVPEEKVDIVRNYVGHIEGLSVASIKTIQYIYMKHCCFNGYCVYSEDV